MGSAWALKGRVALPCVDGSRVVFRQWGRSVSSRRFQQDRAWPCADFTQLFDCQKTVVFTLHY